MCSVCGLSSLLITDAQEVVEKSYWVSVGGGEIIYWGQNRRTQTQGTWTPKGLLCWGLVIWKRGRGSPLHVFCGTLLMESNCGVRQCLFLFYCFWWNCRVVVILCCLSHQVEREEGKRQRKTDRDRRRGPWWLLHHLLEEVPAHIQTEINLLIRQAESCLEKYKCLLFSFTAEAGSFISIQPPIRLCRVRHGYHTHYVSRNLVGAYSTQFNCVPLEYNSS